MELLVVHYMGSTMIMHAIHAVLGDSRPADSSTYQPSHGSVCVQVPRMDVGVDKLVMAAKSFAEEEGLWQGVGVGIVLHGQVG